MSGAPWNKPIPASLYVAGEDIPAGSSVIVARDGKAYVAGSVVGVVIGEAVENIREGFRCCVVLCEVREDDA